MPLRSLMLPLLLWFWLNALPALGGGSSPGSAPSSQEAPIPIAGTEGFAGASSIQVGPDGRVHAMFRRERIMKVVDPAELRVETVRLDQAELSPFPGRFGWVRDTLWVSNSDQTALLLLDRAGGVARRLSVSLPGPIGAVSALGVAAFLPGDRLLVRSTASLGAMAAADPRFRPVTGGVPQQAYPSESVIELPLWLCRPDGSVVKTVVSLSTRNRAAALLPPGGTGPRGIKMLQGGQPFGDFPMLAWSANGLNVVVVDRRVDARVAAPTYRVARIGPAGDTLMIRDVPYTPVPMKEEWVETEAARLGSGLAEDPAAAAAAAKSVMFIPPWLPPVTGILVDLDGWTWVARESVPEAEHLRWEVFSPDGTPVMTVDVPSHLRVRAVRRQVAWATDTLTGEGRLWRIGTASDAR